DHHRNSAIAGNPNSWIRSAFTEEWVCISKKSSAAVCIEHQTEQYPSISRYERQVVLVVVENFTNVPWPEIRVIQS
ncbi:unnamed protein product, partial [Ectocarpus sp. 13 AM-2016]